MLNRVVLIGRLTSDPELRYTTTGTAVCKFTLAVERPFSSNGEKETDFINIVVWRKAAEACANYLKKGRMTAVDGRLQIRHYENNEGRRIYVTEVIAETVKFLESSRTSNDSHQSADPFQADSSPIDISDDDLPF